MVSLVYLNESDLNNGEILVARVTVDIEYRVYIDNQCHYLFFKAIDGWYVTSYRDMGSWKFLKRTHGDKMKMEWLI